MNASKIQMTVVEVLQDIQSASGLECPPIGIELKPVDELPGFDSKIWPVAIGMIGSKLGIPIASDVNIFRQDNSCDALTIGEIVSKVEAVAEAMAESQPKAQAH